MFDFKRDRGEGGRYQEALDAYLDNTLTPAERARFETQMAADTRLRAEVEQQRALRLQLRAMPRRRVPRSFALDPAAYRRPKAQPLLQLYPALRGASALTAFLLIFVLALGALNGQFRAGGPVTASVLQEAAPAAVEEAELDTPLESAASVADEAMKTPPEEAMAAEAAGAQPVGTPVAAPGSTDLSLGATEAEATALPPGDAARETADPAATAANDVTNQTYAEDSANVSEPADSATSLLPLQIGLGVLFAITLALWLMARRARPF